MAQTRAEWLESRKKYLGASDVAAVLGRSRFRTKTEVYMEKVGLSAGSEETEGMRNGRRIQPVTIEIYEERTGNKVEQDPPTVFDKRFPWLGANLDGMVVGQPIPVEAKAGTPYYKRTDWGDDGSDLIPEEYLIQCQTQMLLTQTRVSHVPVFFDIHTVKIYIVPFSEGIANAIVDLTKPFWYENVVKQIPPPIVGDEASRKLLAAMFPYASEQEWEPTGNELEELRDLLDSRIIALREQSDADSKVLEIDNRIKQMMGDKSKFVGLGYSITWSNVAGRKTFDHERFLIDQKVPVALREKYTEVGKQTRRFQVKVKKDA